MDGEIRGRGLPAKHEAVLLEVAVEAAEEAAIARLDDGRGDFVGAHDTEPGDLSLAHHLLDRGHRIVRGRALGPHGQHPGSLLDIGCMPPAIMEHALGQPLVGVVFENLVEERDHGIRRDGAAAGECLLKATDQRRGIRGRHNLALGIGQVEGRKQGHLGHGQRLLLG